MSAVEPCGEFSPPALPRLRSIEINAFEHDGEEWLYLHDRSGLAPDVQIPRGLAPLLGLMDGRHSAAAIVRLAQAHYTERLQPGFVEKLIAELDELHLLESPRLQSHRDAVERAFAAGTVRPAAFAGKSYPGGEAELRVYMEDLHLRGQTLLPPAPLRAYQPEWVRGIVVPHIDFRRGGPEEALAYLPLLENVAVTGRPFDTLVAFGIAHAGVEYPFCAADKDYETPLGTALCDREFLGDLRARVGERLLAEQYAHVNEHSVEFVADFLQFYPELCAARLVPVLCGGFWEPTRGRYSPALDPDISQFMAALREVTREHEARGKKIGFIASVDGAHVGSNFGDPTRLTDRRLQEIRQADRQWCAAIEAGDAEALHAHFARDQNRFSVDAHPAVYTLLAAFPSWRDQLLAYNQAYDQSANSVVSFATLVVFEPS